MTALERFRAALCGEPTSELPRQPITMQFASRLIGRPFLDYITDYRVMVAGQLAVAEQFEVDCLQTISDPAREVHDLGGNPTYLPDEAPFLEDQNALLADKSALTHLRLPDPLGGGRMHDRVMAVALLREQAGPDISVQGWVEGPVAMGTDLRGMQPLFIDILDDPDFVRDLFAFATEMEIAFAKAQIDAGADTIGIGDAAASLISAKAYEELAFPYEKQLVEAIHGAGAVVRFHVCGNTTHLIDAFSKLGVDMFDVDYLCPLDHARRGMPEVALLGNMNPTTVLLRGSPEEVYETLAECHRQAGARFVVGAGCEVPKGTPHENFQAMIQYARDHPGLAAG